MFHDRAMTQGAISLDNGELVALLAELVRFESPDPPGCEIEIAGFIHALLERHGIEARLDEFAPGRANVLGRIGGTGEHPALVFSAHMDTMPPGTRPWRHGPYSGTVEAGRIYGRGTCDMKSGLAAMIAAAVALKNSSKPLGGDLILAFSGGESSNCLGAKVFAETGVLKDAGTLLVSEPTSLKVVTAEKGALWLRVTAHGRSGHASGGPDDDANAILKLVSHLDRLRSLAALEGGHPLLGSASVSVGRIDGGTAVNMTPDHCHAEIDVRFLPHHDPDAIERAMAEIAGNQLEIERLDCKPAVETPIDHPFVATCLDACAVELGAAEGPFGVSYYSDSSVLVPAFGLPRVIVGPGELGLSGSHDEYCEIDKLHAAARIFQRIATLTLTGKGCGP